MQSDLKDPSEQRKRPQIKTIIEQSMFKWMHQYVVGCAGTFANVQFQMLGRS